ncbi:hypothetical protein OEZ85_013001 [Tetradesmus obliquus]|uniref:Cytidyltransferase-like domain-containing protein n=1 Tax=Tetradesmus obliquus TaxID=3088 RepID=A0ABY8U4L3_TETOB|nr:hypothetical protein OEZ85_013001 [Tetradesmus obliquus]
MLSQVIRATYRRIHGAPTTAYTKLRKPGLLLGLGGLAAAGLALQVAADAPDSADDGQLPTDKLACRIDAAAPRHPTVLVACGSFNPPTIMHLRMFDLATAALAQRGYDVWGCYMSPVADAYGKKGLAPVQQRLQMCRLAAADTSNVMVDSWEATQPGYTRTIQVLRHVQGTDVEQLLQQPGSLLHQYRDNVIIVEEPVPNNVSSTAVRRLLAQQQPVRYLVPDAVIAYIKQHHLYQQQQQQRAQGK